MKKKTLQKYGWLASGVGLKLDGQSGLLYGDVGGYRVLVYAENENYPYRLTAAVSVKSEQGFLSPDEMKAFAKAHKPVWVLNQEGFAVKMHLKNLGSGDKLLMGLKESLAAFTEMLRLHGFQNCCQTCGELLPTNPCVVGGSFMELCDGCFVGLQQNEALRSSQQKQKKENVVGGVVGALIGSLLGVACIIILSQLGYVAALSGLVMAVCTLKGYELLGGKLSTKGVVIGAVVMLIMIYVGNQLDWAILVVQEFEVGIADAFRAVPMLLSEEIIEPSVYWLDLALVYVFALLGAVPTMKSALNNQRDGSALYRLEDSAPVVNAGI